MRRFNFKKLTALFLFIVIAFICQSCLVSRCKRPQIVGYIYDSITRQPIANCKVGENLTDAKGYFQLKEQRYSQFTFIGYEAPPILVNEAIYKEDYEKKAIQLFNRFGGGNRKGTIHNADTIFLKRILISTDYK